MCTDDLTETTPYELQLSFYLPPRICTFCKVLRYMLTDASGGHSGCDSVGPLIQEEAGCESIGKWNKGRAGSRGGCLGCWQEDKSRLTPV